MEALLAAAVRRDDVRAAARAAERLACARAPSSLSSSSSSSSSSSPYSSSSFSYSSSLSSSPVHINVPAGVAATVLDAPLGVPGQWAVWTGLGSTAAAVRAVRTGAVPQRDNAKAWLQATLLYVLMRLAAASRDEEAAEPALRDARALFAEAAVRTCPCACRPAPAYTKCSPN